MTDNNVTVDIVNNDINITNEELHVEFTSSDVIVEYNFGDTTIIERGGSKGWGVYRDTVLTQASPLFCSADVRTLLTNNSESSLEHFKEDFQSHDFIVNDRIRSKSIFDSYTYRIGFWADSEIINNEMVISLDIGGGVGSIQSERVSLIHNVGEAKFYTVNFVVYALDTFLQNGAGIYIQPTGNVKIWGTEYFIRVEHG